MANPKEPIFGLIPIVSSSGEASYCLDTSPDAIENMVLKWESRIAHLQQKVQNYPTNIMGCNYLQPSDIVITCYYNTTVWSYVLKKAEKRWL